MEFSVYNPVRIDFGPGRVASLGSGVSFLGRKVFIVTMENLISVGILESVLESLRNSNLDYVVYADVNPEPKTKDIDEAAAVLRNSGCDVVLGLGGGSCIDFAKSLAICARHEKEAWAYVNLSNRPPSPVDRSLVLPIVAVPTTSGTGSEVTPYAVLTNSETIQKGTIKETSIYPKAAIIDPELTLSLPPELTAATGVDALTHAMESYFNVLNRNPYSDMVVMESLRWLVPNLCRSYREGGNLEARTGMSWGSTLAGIAISQAGTTVVHALAQPLGARLGLPHGISVAVFLPAVLKHTFPSELGRFVELSRILGVQEDGNPEEAALEGLDRLKDLLGEIDMPPKLSSLGAGDDIVTDLVEDVVTYMSRPLHQHPKVFTRGELADIVRDSF